MGRAKLDARGGRKRGGGGGGFPARRSQFRPGIYPINFCSVEWQRARQFGPSILTLYRILPATKSGRRAAASRGSPSPTAPPSPHNHLPPPPPLSLVRRREISSSSCSSSVPVLRGRIHFRQSFCSVLPFIASSSSFRPVNCACPLPPPKGRGEGRSTFT